MCATNQYALDLSYDGVRQSAALVKNANGALPLAKASSPYTIAVIGPNANLSKSDVSYYGPQVPT